MMGAGDNKAAQGPMLTGIYSAVARIWGMKSAESTRKTKPLTPDALCSSLWRSRG